MGLKMHEDSLSDLDSLISPIYALTTVGGAHGTVGWMGYKAVAPADSDYDDDDEDDGGGPKTRTVSVFLIDIGLSPKMFDAILHIVVIFLVLFIIINCLCKFVWLFLK